MRNVRLLFPGVVLCRAQGCAAGPDYVRPESGLEKVDMRVQGAEQGKGLPVESSVDAFSGRIVA